MSKRINLVDETFERLKVVEELPSSKGKRYFRCECKCGNEKTVEYSKLKYGTTKSCGCLNDELRRSRYKDLTNMTFGRLTALFRDGDTKIKGSLVWICKCKCDRLIPVSAKDLVSKNTQSCGCANIERISNLQKENEQTRYVDGVFVPLLQQKTQSNSKTGIKGVSVHVGKNGKERYVANITFKGVRQYLGIFNTKEAAAEARAEAEKKYFQPYIDKK